MLNINVADTKKRQPFFLSRRNFGAIDLFSYPLDKVALLPVGVTLKSHSGAILLPILAMWPTVREMMLFWQMGNHTDHDGYRCFFLFFWAEGRV